MKHFSSAASRPAISPAPSSAVLHPGFVPEISAEVEAPYLTHRDKDVAGVAANSIQTSVETSVEAWSEAEWNAIVSCDEPQMRHDFLRATEKSQMDCTATYVGASVNGRLSAVAVVYNTDIDVFTLASPRLARRVQKLRRGPLKRLLILRAAVCGPLITNCRPALAINDALEAKVRALLTQRLIETIDGLPGGGLRLFFELPPECVAQWGAALEKSGYAKGYSLPGCRLDLSWRDFEDYVGQMRKFYRRSVRDDEAAASELDIKIEADFAATAEEAHALYNNVVDNAQSVFQRLTPQFFKAFAACEQSRLVTAREKSTGRLVGMELLVVGGKVVQDIYTGIDYAFNARYHTYFNLIYPAIKLGLAEGHERVSLGQTSYAFKSRLGVSFFDNFLFLKHRNWFVNALISRFRNVICPITPTQTHRVFKES